MKFTLGEILSVTTGHLLCPIDRIYAILNHVLSDNIMTHQIPRALRQAMPEILRQHPQLEDATGEITADNWQQFVADQERRYGHELEIMPLPGSHHVDPVTEAEAMLGGDSVRPKIIVI